MFFKIVNRWGKEYHGSKLSVLTKDEAQRVADELNEYEV
jgi:hypothetical protein